MRSALAAFSLALFVPFIAWAQTESAVATITMQPAYASPRSTVRFTVVSPVLDLAASTIVWSVNGSAVKEGEGATFIETTLGDAGESTDVNVRITVDGTTNTVSTIVTPAALDLVWESKGFVPPLYLGRSLASAGTKLTLVAMPMFGTSANPVAAKDLVYTWRKGNTALGTLSGKGKSSITLDSPTLYGSDTISVEARTVGGETVALASARVSSEEPPLILYEEHPLFGVLFHKALTGTTKVAEAERSFVAYPFFAPARTENDPALSYEWRVNRLRVSPDSTRPSRITINAAGSDGVALVDLDVGHSSNFFYSTTGLWRINFNDAGGDEADPFAPNTSF